MILRAEKISKKYPRKTKNANFFYAVSETDFELSENSLIEICGRSGSGKSTFLNMVCGILTPSSGKILIYDENKTSLQDLTRQSPVDLYSIEDDARSAFRNKNFGVIPQGQSGLSSLSVLENVKLPALVYGEDSSELNCFALSLLEKVGIADLKNEFPQNLSGGEMRRMAIARALINKPKFIFADEPTSDLDDENTQNILGLLRQISKEGASVLLVTHEVGAEKYADKVFRMDGGVLREEVHCP